MVCQITFEPSPFRWVALGVLVFGGLLLVRNYANRRTGIAWICMLLKLIGLAVLAAIRFQRLEGHIGPDAARADDAHIG